MSNTEASPNTAPNRPSEAINPGIKKRGPAFWLAMIVIIIGGAGAWLANFIHRAIDYTETDDAYLAGHVHLISARIDGSVLEVLVDENQTVEAAQVLARLDPLASQIALDKSRAALDSARADALRAHAAVEQAKAEESQARAQVAVAQAQEGQSEAELDLANVNSGRSERLFQADTRTISKSTVDTNRTTAAASAASAWPP